MVSDVVIKRALERALDECIYAEAGRGETIYKVEGNILYNRVKAIVDMIPDTRKVNLVEPTEKGKERNEM